MVFGATSASCSVWWVPRLSWIVVHRPLRMSLSISSSQAHIVLILWYSFPSHLQDRLILSVHIKLYLHLHCLLPYTSWFYSNCHLLLSSRPDVVALDPWSGHFRLKYSTPRLSWWWGGWAIDFEENVNVWSAGFFSSSWGCEEISHLRADFQNARYQQRSSPPHRERMWRNDTLGIVVKVLAGRQRLKAGHLWLSS